MKTIHIAIIVIGALATPQAASALSFSTYRETVLSGIADSMTEYRKEHPNSAVPDFADLAGTNIWAWERMEHYLGQPITDAFVVLKPSNRFAVPPPSDGKVAILMAAPTLDSRYGAGLVRRVIYEDKSGAFVSKTFSDSALQEEASKIGYALPQEKVVEENIPQNILDWGAGTKATNANEAFLEKSPDHKSTSVIDHSSASYQTNETARIGTTSIIASTEKPTQPTRWWLPVAVLAGIGSIAYLLVRASRRNTEF